VRILGIDPGYHRCGWGVVERAQPGRAGWRLLASGAIITDAAASFPLRLHALSTELDLLLALWQPAALAIEELYFAKNAKTAMGVAQARGAILARAAGRAVAIAEYAPSTIKSQLTGNGAADKGQVAFMVRRLVGAPAADGSGAEPSAKALDDELDAIAVALCHCLRGAAPAATALLAASAGRRR
jgi:crossover junction endodeoxyribonuclease RuvC